VFAEGAAAWPVRTAGRGAWRGRSWQRGSRGTARRPGRHGNSRWSTARLTRALT